MGGAIFFQIALHCSWVDRMGLTFGSTGKGDEVW